MFKNNAIKKFAIVIASLALIVPLASVGNSSVSANHVSHKRVARVAKKHVHHYYKFAYNKKEYQKYLKQVRVYKKGAEKINTLFHTNKKSANFRKGFNNALYNVWNHKLAGNKQYREGFVLANAYSVNGNTSKKSMKHSLSYYKSSMKLGGLGTGSAVSQWQNEAHIDTL